MIFKPSRYVLVFGAAMLGLVVLTFAVDRVFGLPLSGPWVTLVPALVAAMIEGQRFARDSSRELPSREAWKAAVYMSVIALGLNLMLAAMILQAAPGALAAILEQPLMAIGGLLLFFGLWLVTNRFFFTIGIRNERAAAKRRG